MSVIARKPRHRSRKHRTLNTAQAILAVAEEMCGSVGVTKLKLADIASALGIEPPSLYRHYNGLNGLIAALGEVAIQAEIETFAGVQELPFDNALKLQAERSFDLYLTRPGIARFIMVDLAIPRGIHVFKNSENLDLIKELFRLENELLQRGLQEKRIRPMSLTSFIAARMGPAMLAFAFKDMQSDRSKTDLEILKREYINSVTTMLVPND